MLNKLKVLVQKLASDIKSADYKDPGVLVATAIFLAIPVLVGFAAHRLAQPPNDIRASSVMIVNRSMNHGGTGIILASNAIQSSILTNDHVCKAVKTGGIVRATTGDYQIASIIESEVSDLCLVQVLADLGVNTNLAQKAPRFYDESLVSGHPALMPNVISTGHMSGRQIIQVMVGMRPCTTEEKGGELGLACMFFGGIPIVKSYESVLVTATIMPGSSGSGVYNKKGELNGVVFAGSQGFGYAWTVPYEQVLNFLYKEHQALKKQDISQELSLIEGNDDSKKIREAIAKCPTETDSVIVEMCNIIKRDMIWRN